MIKTTHTPGPWGCVDTSNHAHDYRLTKPNGAPLPLSIVANDHSEQRANARLIAAAPDLLAALQTIMGLVYMTGPRRLADYKIPLSDARAAIAKATAASNA
jgi:hypothetical protein